MSDNEYGGATIVPLKTTGELRVSTDDTTFKLSPSEAADIGNILDGTRVPDALLVVDDPREFANGLKEQAARL